jgi:hypothetical protein
MNRAPTTAITLAALLMSFPHPHHQPHPVEQLPDAYIAAPTVTVAANATAQTVTTSID